jgi:uncharacterized protein
LEKNSRHIPQRTCITCRKVMDKRNLVRLVRSGDGAVKVDETGRMPGRGAYLCGDCLTGGTGVKNLEHALRARLTAEDKEQIIISARDTLSRT